LNRATSISRAQFEKNLLAARWIRTVGAQGKVIEYAKDGARYMVRDGAKSTGGPTTDFYKSGSESIDLKIRLRG